MYRPNNARNCMLTVPVMQINQCILGSTVSVKQWSKGHMPYPDVFSIVSSHTNVKQLNAYQVQQGCVEDVLVVRIIPTHLCDPDIQEVIH